METYFYNRTPYVVLQTPVPNCFLELDQHFDGLFGEHGKAVRDVKVAIAENACRRMAAIDMFAEYITEELREREAYRAAAVIGSLLVSHLGACKSLFDAVSVGLSRLYRLKLACKNQDFSKGAFWKELRQTPSGVHDRYLRFKAFSGEVVRWRDAAVHRIAPLVVVHVRRHPAQVRPEEREVKMAAAPDLDMVQLLLDGPRTVQWKDPLDLHREWRPRFVCLCQEICDDVRNAGL